MCLYISLLKTLQRLHSAHRIGAAEATTAPGSPLIICGDLNARSYAWESWHTEHDIRHRNQESFKRGRKLEELAQYHNLTVLNNGEVTWRQGNIKSSPDATLFRGGDNIRKIVWSTDTRSTYSQLSDHVPIVIKIDEHEEVTTKQIKYDFKKADWPKYNKTLETKLEVLKQSNVLDLPSDQIVDAIMTAITDTADEIIPKKTTCQHSKPFWNQELTEKLQAAKKARNRRLKRNDPNNTKALIEARNNFHHSFEKAKSDWLLKTCEELKAKDVDLWKKVDKILNGTKTAPVQPLQIGDTNCYDFDDEKIAKRMETVHITRENVDTSSFDETHKKTIEKEVDDFTNNTNLNKDAWNQEDYNCDITEQEVKASIGKTKDDSAPGPDRVHPLLITRAGYFMVNLLTSMFQTFWERGEFPKPFKQGNVIYLPKPGKDTYNTEKSFRPICLTSIAAKIFERLIARRLVAYLLSIGFFNDTQYAYQQGADCEQAILDMCLDIWKGFCNKKVAAVAFIDLEGAFDAVWRKGLLHKLSALGVKGRLYKAIESFLNSRFSRSYVNSFVSDWIETTIGVPQGSVLSALLFLIYTKDIAKDVAHNTRYADDLTVCGFEDTPAKAAEELEKSLAKVHEWCTLNRIKANPKKTTCMCVTPRGHQNIDVKMNGITIKQVATQKVLGITLDENFTFKAHVEDCAARANKALGKIAVLSSCMGGASAEVLLILYKGCVLPLLGYGYATWCSTNSIAQLESVQQSALTLILGAMPNSSGAAMEVMTNIMPLQIRLEVSLVQTFLRIFRKPNDNSLKQKIIQLRLDPQFIMMNRTNPLSQLRLAEMTLADFNVDNIEPMIQETLEDIVRENNMELIITKRDIGASGSRTKAQEKEAQEIALSYLTAAGNEAVIFTDGSATPNPGPCGAGVCAYWAGINADCSEISLPVSKHSSSYHGELKAIDAAIETAAMRQHQGDLSILSDCQSALKTATNDEISLNFSSLSQNIKKNAAKIKGTIKLIWIAGHADIDSNEKADALAKQGAAAAPKCKDLGFDNLSCSEAKTRLRSNAIKKWKCRWLRQNTGSTMVEQINPKRKLKQVYSREVEVKVHRMILQHTKLEEHMHQMYPEANPTPFCECYSDTGTVDHFLQSCPTHCIARSTMLNTIESSSGNLI